MEIKNILEIADQGPKLTEDEIFLFEKKIGMIFPEDYRQFMLLNNGGIPCQDVIDIKEFPGKTTDVQVFFRIGGSIESSELLWNISLIKEVYLNKKLIPIAGDSSGAIFCIDISDKNNADVVFYDWGFLQKNQVYREIYHVANSFYEFIMKMRCD
jgi:cell wall assembly regulator SMI1